MYFIPRNNTKLYCFIAGMRPAYRYFFTLLCLSVLTYAWLFGVYFQVQGVIDRYQGDIKQQQDHRSSVVRAKSEKKQLEESVAYLRNALHDYAKKGQTANQDQMQQLVDASKKSGLGMRSCVIEKEHHNDWYEQRCVACEFVGSLESLVKFFNTCSKNKLIICDTLRITRTEKHTSEITCLLNIYTINMN